MPAPIRYRIAALRPEAHLFEVTVAIARPDPAGQLLALPAWIPGSYMIRDFARHIVELHAEAGGRGIAAEKIDKHTWRVAKVRGPLTVRCLVYAWDLSVRGAHLDRSHGFFNGTSLFLRVCGQEQAPCEVELVRPVDEPCAGWRVATTLPAKRVNAAGFGRYRAESYERLIDHPVEMGTFQRVNFRAGGIPHAVVVTGHATFDGERLAADLQRICEHHMRLFEPKGGKPPFERYLFLVMAVGEGYGGLEHADCTALLCSRDDLPQPGEAQPAAGKPMREAYRGFLGLCSHEYFHAWNVKRIRPAELVAPDLERENYTRQLWTFEGFTSYYDDLALVRSGAVASDDYLALVARTVTGVWRGGGRHRQSIAESSFDAWTKFYRQDENAPNAIVSYYTKGSLVALALDLTLRIESRGKLSLDEVMRSLWRDHGRTGTGVAEDTVQRIAEALSGLKLKRFFERHVYGTDDPPLAELLARVGVELRWEAAGKQPWLGWITVTEGSDVKLKVVLEDSPVQRAGLSGGDVLAAVDGLRVTPANLDASLARLPAGRPVAVHAFRRDELVCVTLTPEATRKDQCRLVFDAGAPAVARRLRDAWLGTAHDKPKRSKT